MTTTPLTSTDFDAAASRGRRAALNGLFAAAVCATVALDQWTKHIVIGRLAPGERWPDAASGAASGVARFFTFTHVHNTGMAFGLGQGRSAVFAVVAIVIVTGLAVYQSRLPAHHWWLRIALGLQAGGAIGNLVDRLRQGYVTDFLDFQVWPVFNVADSAIFLGVFVLAWHLWRHPPAPDAAPAVDSAPDPTAMEPPGPEPRLAESRVDAPTAS